MFTIGLSDACVSELVADPVLSGNVTCLTSWNFSSGRILSGN